MHPRDSRRTPRDEADFWSPPTEEQYREYLRSKNYDSDAQSQSVYDDEDERTYNSNAQSEVNRTHYATTDGEEYSGSEPQFRKRGGTFSYAFPRDSNTREGEWDGPRAATPSIPTSVSFAGGRSLSKSQQAASYSEGPSPVMNLRPATMPTASRPGSSPQYTMLPRRRISKSNDQPTNSDFMDMSEGAHYASLSRTFTNPSQSAGRSARGRHRQHARSFSPRKQSTRRQSRPQSVRSRSRQHSSEGNDCSDSSKQRHTYHQHPVTTPPSVSRAYAETTFESPTHNFANKACESNNNITINDVGNIVALETSEKFTPHPTTAAKVRPIAAAVEPTNPFLVGIFFGDGGKDGPVRSSAFNTPLFYLVWYFFLTHWNLAAYVSWVRLNGDLIDNRPPTVVYLLMIIIAQVAFWLGGGPMFFYAAKYCVDGANGDRRRRRWLTRGIALMYILTDVPLWLCDMSIIYYNGHLFVVHSIAWALRLVSFFFGTVIVWYLYMYGLSNWLQVQYVNLYLNPPPRNDMGHVSVIPRVNDLEHFESSRRHSVAHRDDLSEQQKRYNYDESDEETENEGPTRNNHFIPSRRSSSSLLPPSGRRTQRHSHGQTIENAASDRTQFRNEQGQKWSKSSSVLTDRFQRSNVLPSIGRTDGDHQQNATPATHEAQRAAFGSASPQQNISENNVPRPPPYYTLDDEDRIDQSYVSP